VVSEFSPGITSSSTTTRLLGYPERISVQPRSWSPSLYIGTTGFIAHFGIAASGPMLASMLGDICDLDEVEGGRRREGVIFGAESFAWKALTGLGPLAAGLVIDWVGLSERVSPESVSNDVVVGLGLTQGVLMFSFFCLALFFISRYDLTRTRHDRVLAELEARRRGKNSEEESPAEPPPG
jgi:Na+/melibiose symporter-like transporter